MPRLKRSLPVSLTLNRRCRKSLLMLIERDQRGLFIDSFLETDQRLVPLIKQEKSSKFYCGRNLTAELGCDEFLDGNYIGLFREIELGAFSVLVKIVCVRSIHTPRRYDRVDCAAFQTVGLAHTAGGAGFYPLALGVQYCVFDRMGIDVRISLVII